MKDQPRANRGAPALRPAPGRPILPWVMAAWAVAVVVMAAPVLRADLGNFAAALGQGWTRPTAAVLGRTALWETGAVALWAAMMAVLAAQGLAVAPWLGALPAGRVGTVAAWLLGCGVASSLLLGLALVRAWFLPVMVVTLFAAALPGVRRLGRRAAGWRRPGDRWRAAPLLIMAPWMLTPEVTVDAYGYFLSGPERWMAMHGYTVRETVAPYHFPYLAEMLYALPAGLGCDQVTKWLNGSALLGGLLAAAAALGVSGGRAVLAATAVATPIFILTGGKNEGFSTGFVLTVFACGWDNLKRGRSAAAGPVGPLAGFACCVKYLTALNLAWVPLLLWWERRGGRRRPWVVAAGLAAVALAPWLAKSWLLTGDPAYPILSGMFPRLHDGWDERHRQVWRLCSVVTMAPSTLWGRMGDSLLRESPWLVAVLPFALWRGGPARRIALAAGAVYAVWYAAFWGPQTPRWAFPSIGVYAVLAAGVWDGMIAGAGPGPRGIAAACLAVSFAGSAARLASFPNPLPFLTGGVTRRAYAARQTTTLADAQAAARALPAAGALLVVGDERERGWPGPCVMGNHHFSGEAPLIWRLAAAARTPRDLDVRLRQLNVRRLAYNYISAKLAQKTHRPFRWDERMVALYEGWCRTRLVLLSQPGGCDYLNGGYALYRVEGRARPGDDRAVHFLPGAEVFMQDAYEAKEQGRSDAAVAALVALTRAHPAVGSFRSELGYLYTERNDAARAWPELQRATAAGVRDGLNYPSLGGAALGLGKLDEAERVINESLPWYPVHRETLRVNLGVVHYARALAAAQKGALAAALPWLDRAERDLDFVPSDPAGSLARERSEKAAYVFGLKGDIARGQQRVADAVAAYREACRLGAGLGTAAAWGRMLSELTAGARL